MKAAKWQGVLPQWTDSHACRYQRECCAASAELEGSGTDLSARLWLTPAAPVKLPQAASCIRGWLAQWSRGVEVRPICGGMCWHAAVSCQHRASLARLLSRGLVILPCLGSVGGPIACLPISQLLTLSNNTEAVDHPQTARRIALDCASARHMMAKNCPCTCPSAEIAKNPSDPAHTAACYQATKSGD